MTEKDHVTKLAINHLVESVIDGSIELTADTKKELARVSRNTELRWHVLGWKIIVRCPNCYSKMMSDCGRYTCYMCDEDYIIISRTLLDICKNCISYANKTCMGSIKTNDLDKPILVSKRTGKVIPDWVFSKERE